jgi:hypothetical protein
VSSRRSRARSRRSGCRRRRSTPGCPEARVVFGAWLDSQLAAIDSVLPTAPAKGPESWLAAARPVLVAPARDGVDAFQGDAPRGLFTSGGRSRASCSTAALRPRRPTPTRRS